MRRDKEARNSVENLFDPYRLQDYDGVNNTKLSDGLGMSSIGEGLVERDGIMFGSVAADAVQNFVDEPMDGV